MEEQPQNMNGNEASADDVNDKHVEEQDISGYFAQFSLDDDVEVEGEQKDASTAQTKPEGVHKMHKKKRKKKDAAQVERERKLKEAMVEKGAYRKSKNKKAEGESWKDVYWSMCEEEEGEGEAELPREQAGLVAGEVSVATTWTLIDDHQLDPARLQAAQSREKATPTLPPAQRGTSSPSPSQTREKREIN